MACSEDVDLWLCKVCFTDEVTIVFLPCGHLVCCTSCGNRIVNCCICRQFIRGTVPIEKTEIQMNITRCE